MLLGYPAGCTTDIEKIVREMLGKYTPPPHGLFDLDNLLEHVSWWLGEQVRKVY